MISGPVVILSLVAAALVVQLSDLDLPLGLATGLAALTVAAFPIVRRIATHSFDMFEPVVSGCIMLAILFGARPIWMATSGDMTANQGARGALDISSRFDQVTMLGFIATLAFVVGYELTSAAPLGSKERRPAHKGLRLDRRGFGAFAIAAWVLGLGLFTVHLVIGGGVVQSLKLMLGGRSQAVTESLTLTSSEYLAAAPILLACVAIVLVAIKGTSLSRSQKVLVVVSALIPAALALLLGARRFVIPSVLIPVVVYYLLAGRRPSLTRLAIIVPVVFILLSTVIVARSAGARQQQGGVVAIFTEALSKPAESWNNFIGGHDTSMVAWLGVEVYTLDSGASDYTYGKASIGDLLLAPIPSQLVPSKPINARDGLLIDIFGSRCAEGACPDFSTVGTFYQDFGYWGVIGGMLLLGVGAAAAWRRFVRSPRDPMALVWAAAVAVFLPILIRAGFSPAFQWGLYFVIPSLVGIHFSGVGDAPVPKAVRAPSAQVPEPGGSR